MIYQVGKKQCSNSGRKRNDIDPWNVILLPTPLPSGISWASNPPPPTPTISLEFPIPSVVHVGVWIFSGTCTHCLKIIIIFYCTYVLNKNKNIVNAGYWVLSENQRNFGCNISVRHPSIKSLGGREGNEVSAYRGVEYVIFSWQDLNHARNGTAIFVKFKN